ncbi:MAG: hypothetical protein MUF59_07355 [Candidatus Krumholzibacteria bacterium]|jgi:hypothetical protein|nr:hypothetical protein [Candidatus Krumholzibacteria bacterium]
MKKGKIRSALVLFTIVTFASAVQVCSEPVIHGDTDVDLAGLVISAPVFTEEVETVSHQGAADTLQTIEIELEKETGSNIYKEIAMVTVVAFFAFYIIKTVFFSEDDEATEDDGGGKDIPYYGMFLTLNP